jgi:hypothetical protein
MAQIKQLISFLFALIGISITSEGVGVFSEINVLGLVYLNFIPVIKNFLLFFSIQLIVCICLFGFLFQIRINNVLICMNCYHRILSP